MIPVLVQTVASVPVCNRFYRRTLRNCKLFAWTMYPPGSKLRPSELYLSVLSQCTNLRALLLHVTLAVFTPRIAPLWKLPSLQCVALLLEDPFSNFMVLGTGFMRMINFLGLSSSSCFSPMTCMIAPVLFRIFAATTSASLSSACQIT